MSVYYLYMCIVTFDDGVCDIAGWHFVVGGAGRLLTQDVGTKKMISQFTVKLYVKTYNRRFNLTKYVWLK